MSWESNFLSMNVKMRKKRRPTTRRAVQKPTGATTEPSNLPAIIGEIHITANTPSLAIAISRPIARAISLPLNHFAMALDTVVPAISQPQPKIMNPRQAIFALPGRATHQLSSQPQRAEVWNASLMPIYFMAAPPTISDAERRPVNLTPILSRMMPAKMRKKQNTLRKYSDAA